MFNSKIVVFVVLLSSLVAFHSAEASRESLLRELGGLFSNERLVGLDAYATLNSLQRIVDHLSVETSSFSTTTTEFDHLEELAKQIIQLVPESENRCADMEQLRKYNILIHNEHVEPSFEIGVSNVYLMLRFFQTTQLDLCSTMVIKEIYDLYRNFESNHKQTVQAFQRLLNHYSERTATDKTRIIKVSVDLLAPTKINFKKAGREAFDKEYSEIILSTCNYLENQIGEKARKYRQICDLKTHGETWKPASVVEVVRMCAKILADASIYSDLTYEAATKPSKGFKCFSFK